MLKGKQTMKEKLTIAIVGCGAFAQFFVPLFKNHPLTEKVYVCDIIPERAKEYSERFSVVIIDTYEQILEDMSINCIAYFTQRHLHGDIVKRALKAGKNVYSAVPMASTVDECREICELVKDSGKIYMLGETCYYYPCAMYCREAFKEGKFGEFKYGASQYYHHIDAISYGKRHAERGMPPLLYPTHSTGMILAAVDSYAVKVSCFGTKADSEDTAFGKGNNEWDNEFIDQFILMELANGGCARVTEARSFGWCKPSSYISSLYGTKGGYEFSNAQHILVEKDYTVGKDEKERVHLTDVSDYVNTSGMIENYDKADFKEQVANGEWQWDCVAKVQAEEMKRLPTEYADLPNGHMATHKLLIDDFCKAAYTGEKPVLNEKFAAKVNLPGLVAIESAKMGGIPLEVPTFYLD